VVDSAFVKGKMSVADGDSFLAFLRFPRAASSNLCASVLRSVHEGGWEVCIATRCVTMIFSTRLESQSTGRVRCVRDVSVCDFSQRRCPVTK